MQKLKVCVIGCGNAGLVTVKELLDEGHSVICYETNDGIGGNFNKSVESYESFRLTITQKTMCFSSMPAPADEPPAYWTRPKYLDYLTRFAEHFNIIPHVNFNCTVRKIIPTSEGKYDVHVESAGKLNTEIFDAVAVCQGAHRPSSPRVPSFNGADKFRGEILHSASYSEPTRFRGKKVVCVGFGESAADIVTEISGVTSECWVTFRNWPSLAMRWDASGFTGDAFSIRASQKLPSRLRGKLVRDMTKISAGSDNPRVRLVAEWNLKCENHMHKFLQKNDDFVPRVLEGSLKVHAQAVKKLTENSIVFEDGKEIEADIVLCCTGYVESGPPDIIEGVPKVENVRDCFKHSIHPEIGPRVAFIGWARPAQGGVPACSEMQARYFSLLCSGKKQLPPKEKLKALIERDRRMEERDYFMQPYIKTLVNYCVYLDSMAILIGCMPRFRDLWNHPALLIRFVFGTNIPSWYRFVGPHSNRKLALENICHMPVPFSIKRMFKFTWINLKLWVQHKISRVTPEYSLFG